MSEEIARKVKAARAKLELSQAQAAAVLGVPKATLIKWEQNQRTPRGLALEALNAKLDAILSPSALKKKKRPAE
jgi:DNA-binding transcriptional regulator YiaG